MPRKRQHDTAQADGQLRREVVALLEHGRALIDKGHTRGAYARDRHSHIVSITSEKAVRFCAAGAVIRAEIELFGEIWEEVEGELPEGIDGSPRLLVALAHLNVACIALTLSPLLVGSPETLAPAVEGLLSTGPARQIVDRTNDVRFVSRKHVLRWFDLALRVNSLKPRPKPES